MVDVIDAEKQSPPLTVQGGPQGPQGPVGVRLPVPTFVPAPPAQVPKKPPVPGASLISRVSEIMGIAKPPSSLILGNSSSLISPYFHFMLYGNPSAWKTSTAAKFMGPANTRIIVTRRAEQMIPLSGLGFEFVVVADAEALRYALLYPEKIWPAWATLPDRTLIVDDVTEGVSVLVDDHRFYFDEKKQETVELKDPRQAYKKAADELHDLFKINLGKAQHVGLIAVERGYDIEGTIDYRIEPDVPNKIAKLLETELEFVFYMVDGDNKMLTKPRMVTRQSSEKNKLTGKPDIWREITFAKSKLPIGSNILVAEEPKDLTAAWTKIKGALGPKK